MDTIEKTDQFIFNTYARMGNALVKGEGIILWDDKGNSYKDFLAGIAVCNLGHCHPGIAEAISEQARELVHVSNLFYTNCQADLARALTDKSFADRAFFGNSGAEANEAAIKLARRYFQAKGEDKRYKIITMTQSFHGRTMATLSATGQDKIKNGFYPLLEGFSHVPFNDFDALKNEYDSNVCAVMLEPIQGEGGVIPADPTYLKQVREFCDQQGILLIFDEIQTGMGRCGHLFAHEIYGIRPDIMTLAKALGNGLPIGAMLATEKAASGFELGSHASTFGGTPLVTHAACKVVEIISEPEFLKNVRAVGDYFKEQLKQLMAKHEDITDVRGEGLLLGMEFNPENKAGHTGAYFVKACMEKGFIINSIQDKILRFAPPLIVKKEEIDELIKVLDDLF